MGAEAGRRDGALRSAYTHGVHELLDTLQQVAPGESESDRKRAAMRILASLTGAILISRAVDDSVLAEEILDVVALSFAARR
jgi:TetR/AcrR family transcriptional repressor of nem operon